MNYRIPCVIIAAAVTLGGCAGGRIKDRALESAARYWKEKASASKGLDVQVVEAEMSDDGLYRIKGVVDGEDRVGVFIPKPGIFLEDSSALANGYSDRIGELEQDLIYWMGRAEASEKENIKLRIQQKKK
jgi:hypothetical protein